MKQVNRQQSRRGNGFVNSKGNVIVEFTILLVLTMMVIFAAVVEDGGVLDNLKEHESRYIKGASAP